MLLIANIILCLALTVMGIIVNLRLRPYLSTKDVKHYVVLSVLSSSAVNALGIIYFPMTTFAVSVFVLPFAVYSVWFKE